MRSHGCRHGNYCTHAHFWSEYRGPRPWTHAADGGPIGDVRRHDRPQEAADADHAGERIGDVRRHDRPQEAADSGSHADHAGDADLTEEGDVQSHIFEQVLDAWLAEQGDGDDPGGHHMAEPAPEPELLQSPPEEGWEACLADGGDIEEALARVRMGVSPEDGSLRMARQALAEPRWEGDGDDPGGQETNRSNAWYVDWQEGEGDDPGGHKADHPGDWSSSGSGAECVDEAQEQVQDDRYLDVQLRLRLRSSSGSSAECVDVDTDEEVLLEQEVLEQVLDGVFDDWEAGCDEADHTGHEAADDPDEQVLEQVMYVVFDDGEEAGSDKADHPGHEAADNPQDPGHEAPGQEAQEQVQDDTTLEDLYGPGMLWHLYGPGASMPGDDAPPSMDMFIGYFGGAHGFSINYLNQRGGVSQQASFARVGAIIDRQHGSYSGCRK